MKHFKLEQFQIDVMRCQVIGSQGAVSLEPKVMDLLVFLAKHQGDVVSQQQIAEAIWPNTTFSSTSVQRSIAVLRKALGDDAKNPRFIVTHPKRGYTLVVAVEKTDEHVNKSVKAGVGRLVSFSVAVAMLLVVLIFWLFKDSQVQYQQLTPVTVTEHNELSPALSPSGRYLAFVRQITDEQADIFIKNLDEGVQQQISKSSGNFAALNWRNDERGVVYVNRKNEGDVIEYVGLDPLLGTSLAPKPLVTLPSKEVAGSVFWTNQNVLLFASVDEKGLNKIHQFTLGSGELVTLLTFADNERITATALSPDHKQLGLAVKKANGLVDIATMVLGNNQVNKIAETNGDIHAIAFHPLDGDLLIANRNRLLNLTMDGQFTPHNFSNFMNIETVAFHPTAEKILLTLTGIDIDILSQSIQQPLSPEITVNTRFADIQPLFGPNGVRMAFQSVRGGVMQLYVRDKDVDRLLFENPQGEELYGFAWSEDGQSIALATETTLYFIDVQSAKAEAKTHQMARFYIRDWYRTGEALLVNIEKDDLLVPAKLDIQSMKLQVLIDKSGSCSTLDEQDNLYLNHVDKVTKINADGQEQVLWQPPEGRIEMIAVGREHLIVESSNDEKVQLWRLSLIDNGDQESVLQSDSPGLADVSPDGKSVLMHSKVTRSRSIVLLH